MPARLQSFALSAVTSALLVACTGPDHVRFEGKPPAFTDFYAYGSLQAAKGQVIAKDGTLWIAEADFGSLGPRLHRVTPLGVMSDVHVPDSGCGIDGIGIGPDGSIWYGATGSCAYVYNRSRIGRLMPSGAVRLYAVPNDRAFMEGMVVDSEGRVYVGEPEAHRIIVRFPNGHFRKYDARGGETMETRIGASRSVWFTGDTSISQLESDGRVKTYPLPQSCGYPSWLATDDKGVWFVPGLNRGRRVVCRLDNTGSLARIATPESAGFLGGITTDSEGGAWFSAEHSVGHILNGGRVVTYPIPQGFFPWPHQATTAGDFIIATPNRSLWLQTTPPGGTGFGMWGGTRKV
jgi:streptogramin lyase